jgi:hypothetical protein
MDSKLCSAIVRLFTHVQGSRIRISKYLIRHRPESRPRISPINKRPYRSRNLYMDRQDVHLPLMALKLWRLQRPHNPRWPRKRQNYASHLPHRAARAPGRVHIHRDCPVFLLQQGKYQHQFCYSCSSRLYLAAL